MQNPFLQVLPALVKAEADGKLTPAEKEAVIRMARRYARRNNVPFDDTFKGALKVIEKATEYIQMAEEERMKRMEKEQCAWATERQNYIW